MGGAGSSVCTPSGMTQVATLGTVAAADTVQPVSTWPSTTCSVTSENNSGVTVEVMITNDGLSGQSTSVWPVDYYIDYAGQYDAGQRYDSALHHGSLYANGKRYTYHKGKYMVG
jgi:hypothetical protein